MTAFGLVQIGLFLVVLVALVQPLGRYMANVYEGEPTWLSRLLSPLERLVYRVAGIDPQSEQDWKQYALALLVFNLAGLVVVYLLQRLQGVLPLNPQGFGAVSPDSAFNTAVSFATNTNWQGYGGETTMSYLTQMLGLGVQNFLSAASGMAVLVALIRGFVRREATGIGNFWVDLTRGTLYILLPLSTLLALALVSQGVVQSFAPYRSVSLVEPLTIQVRRPTDGAAVTDATGRPVLRRADHRADDPARPGREPGRDQAARHQRRRLLQRQLGAPAREPDAAVQLPRDAGDPADPGGALLHVRAHGGRHAAGLGAARRDAGDLRAAGARQLLRRSRPATRAWTGAAWTSRPRPTQPGGNMEGKEARFGIANSALWATATTAASNGSVNSMHGSFTPLGGLVPMWLMQLGEVVFGGVGSGLYGMLMFAIVAVFIAGPDGRAHAGVPRQEDRGVRDEDGVARAADPLPRRPARHGGRERAARGRRAGRQSRDRTASRRSCTRSVPPATTTAAPSAGSRPTTRSTTSRSASRCGSRATG